jgi:ABC-type uncharacterized transport system involved in gliding motility auxiliary subunit
MPEPEDQPKSDALEKPAGKPRRLPRLQIGLNVILQITILFFILLMANYLGYRHYQRWDLSRNQKFSLSEKSVAVLKTLEEPVNIIVWFDEEHRIFRDVLTLLTEYQERSNGKIQLEFVNPLRDPNRSRELQSKYKFNDEENVILLDNGRNSKYVYGADIVEYLPVDPLLAQMKVKPDIKNFSGEQKLTSALQEVQSREKPVVYFTQGHREPDFEGTAEAPSPLSRLKDYLTKENMELKPLTLISHDNIPTDAASVLIIGPQFDLTKRELAMLEEYWERGGRLEIFLDPNYNNTRNLIEFCKRRGLIPRGDRVIKSQTVQQVAIVYTDVAAKFLGGHPVSKPLARVDTVVQGGTQSLKLDPVVAQQQDITLTPLLQADVGYWGEMDYPPAPNTAPLANKGVDTEPPLFLSAVAEQTVGNVTRRLFLTGNSAICEDRTMGNSQNLQLVLSATNWSLNRSELLGIPPKDRSNFQLSLPPKQKSQLWFLCIIAVPATSAVIGLLVWLRRRK